uniref:Uncharacterized protein n=1 Tax=Leersia perrieri TaxID=77586 RepID=A0A0D9WWG4_9ORYZ
MLEPQAVKFIVPCHESGGMTIQHKRYFLDDPPTLDPGALVEATPCIAVAIAIAVDVPWAARWRNTRKPVNTNSDEQDSLVLGQVMPQRNHDYQDATILTDISLSQELAKQHVSTTPNVDHLERSSKQMSTFSALGGREKIGKQKERFSTLICNGKESEDISVSRMGFLEVKKKGMIIDELDRAAKGENADQGGFHPRREVGTKEMIKEASEARQAENVEMESAIARLKRDCRAKDEDRDHAHARLSIRAHPTDSPRKRIVETHLVECDGEVLLVMMHDEAVFNAANATSDVALKCGDGHISHKKFDKWWVDVYVVDWQVNNRAVCLVRIEDLCCTRVHPFRHGLQGVL